MAGFTLPEKPDEVEFTVDFPVYTLADTASSPGRGLLQIIAYTYPCICLYTEEEYARQAIEDLELKGVVPHKIHDGQSLVTLLTGGYGATGVSHVAIDVGNRFKHGTGRIRTVDEYLSAIAAG